MARALAITGALVLALPGCSLVGLDDIELVECQGLADNESLCRAVNERAGIDVETACMVYQCAAPAKGCVLSPKDWDGDGFVAESCDGEGLAAGDLDCDDANDARTPGDDALEVCDGLDNDCDGVIDEGEDVVAMASPLLSISVRNEAQRFHVSEANGTGVLLVGVSSDGDAELTPIDEVNGVLGETVASRPPIAVEATNASQAASLAELAVAATGSSNAPFLAAASVRTDCEGGRLALGFVEADGDGLSFVPPLRDRSNFVVPRNPAEGCDSGGVRDLAIASVERREALVSWLDAPVESQPSCERGELRELYAYGYWLGVNSQSGSTAGAGETFFVVSGEGEPTSLGQTRAQAGAAMLGLAEGEGGFVLGYVDASDRVVLRYVASLGARGEALDISAPFVVAKNESADRVALAVADVAPAAAEDAPRDLLVAWQEGCGTSDQRVRGRRVQLTTDGAFEAIARARTLASGDGGQLGMAPQLSFWPAPVFAESDDSQGAWLLAYRDGGGSVLRAIRLDHDATPVASESPWLLAQGERANALGSAVLYRAGEDALPHAAVVARSTSRDADLEASPLCSVDF